MSKSNRFNDGLGFLVLEEADVGKANPNHEPAGTPEGGQFASGGGGFGTMPMGRAASKEAKKWRKDNQARYDSDPEFRAAVDAATLYTQGDYAHLNAASRFLNTGKWDVVYDDSAVPRWVKENSPLSGSPMGKYKTYFEGQDFEHETARSKYRDGVEALNSAVRSAPISDAPIYRGMNPWAVDRANFALGQTYDVAGVTSFTMDRTVALDFALGTARGQRVGRDGYSTAGVIIEIRGARALNVSALSPWDQKEVLSMGRMRVTNVVPGDRWNATRVYMDYAGDFKKQITRVSREDIVASDIFNEPFLYGELTAPDNFAKSDQPRTLYVKRRLLNAAAVRAWAASQGIKSALSADDMHVTVAFSREPVDWSGLQPALDAVVVQDEVVAKMNPYHDEKGRFAEADDSGGGSLSDFDLHTIAIGDASVRREDLSVAPGIKSENPRSGFGQCTQCAWKQHQLTGAEVHVGYAVERKKYNEARAEFERLANAGRFSDTAPMHLVRTGEIAHAWNVYEGRIIDRALGSRSAKDYIYFGRKVPADVLAGEIASSSNPPDAIASYHMKTVVRSPYYDFSRSPYFAKVGQAHQFPGREGKNGALVLKFESEELTRRWQYYRDAGASWDHDGYRPHVTITYSVAEADVAAMEPFPGVLILGPEELAEVKEDWAGEIEEEPLVKFNPHHDSKTGEFTTGPGSGTTISGGGTEGGGGVAVSPIRLIGGKGKFREKVAEGLAGIPPAHAAAIAHIPVYLQEEAKPGSSGTTTGFFEWKGNTAQRIVIGEKTTTKYTSRSGPANDFTLTSMVKDPGGTLAHEIGHAVDHKRGWIHSYRMLDTLAADAKRLTASERKKAGYYLGDNQEMFAETYRLAFGPKPNKKSIKVFGGLGYDRALDVFSKSVAEIKRIEA